MRNAPFGAMTKQDKMKETFYTGEPSVSYNYAVEEALCFGWIDGRAGTLDEKHSIRRFTPRRAGSSYSRPNIKKSPGTTISGDPWGFFILSENSVSKALKLYHKEISLLTLSFHKLYSAFQPVFCGSISS